MTSIRKSLVLGCVLGIAGCAQNGAGSLPGALGPGGLSMLPNGPRAASSTGRLHRFSGSGGNPALYVFQGPPDGYQPQSGLADIAGTVYGTTYQGGANNEGVVYSVTTGGVGTIMHSFGTKSKDGTFPDGPLTAVNGILYGTTYYGGATGHGTIFSITPSGTYKILYDFGKVAFDCSQPDTALTYVPSKNALYGVAYHGGATGEGCIFELSLVGTKPKESTLYGFTGSASSSTAASAVVFYKNALYGTTPGGGATGHGAVFKVTLSGTESIVYSFGGAPDGVQPQSALTLVGNTFYGVTTYGGTPQAGACGDFGCGTLFKLTPHGKETVLHRFVNIASGQDGQEPQTPMIDAGGTLYGTTGNSTHGYGTIYSLVPSHGVGGYSVFYTFDPGTTANYPETPEAPLISIGGSLYGTTMDDSSVCTNFTDEGCGTVFAVGAAH
jgi:uncharacterized repeat protein (TIGR03803 family)